MVVLSAVHIVGKENEIYSIRPRQIITNGCGTVRDILHTSYLQVSTKNLKLIRGLKAQLSRLTTRVETLREMMEKYLNDDQDMKVCP